MFEVPDWAECAASNVPGLAVCHRSVAKMVTVLLVDDGCDAPGPGVDTLGSCNRHLELIEAHQSSRSEYPHITVSKAEFPAFMEDMLSSVDPG